MKSMHTPVYYYIVNLSQTNALFKYSPHPSEPTSPISTYLAHQNLLAHQYPQEPGYAIPNWIGPGTKPTYAITNHSSLYSRPISFQHDVSPVANDQGPLYSVVRKPAINISPVYAVVRKPTTSRDGAPVIQLRAPAVPRKASFDAAAHSNTAGYQVPMDINLHQNQRNTLFEDNQLLWEGG